jgi:uncharacterized protein
LEHLNLGVLLFLALSGFISAFIDAIVGGGGLISLPALLMTGLPPSTVLGTNKFASSLGSFTSTLSYFKSGKVSFRTVRYLFPFSVIGSILGAFTVRHIPSTFLRPMVIVLLIGVAVYTFVKKDWGKESTFRGLTPKLLFSAIAVALVIGFYDGFFGPGTGSFLIFSFLMIGFDYINASGNAKVLNFGSNIGSLLTFALLGAVQYEYGIIMGISMIVGALTGSQFAIRKGVAWVRPIFILMTLVLVGKQLWTLL